MDKYELESKIKKSKDFLFHLNMLSKLLDIKFDRFVASNEELNEMIEYFQIKEEYEYCNILKNKKARVSSQSSKLEQSNG